MRKYLILALLATAGTALSVYGDTAKSNWSNYCAKCHGDNGKGNTRMGHKLHLEDLTSPKVQAKFTDDDAFKALKGGLKNKEGRTEMKAFGDELSDAELHALVKYVRSLKQ